MEYSSKSLSTDLVLDLDLGDLDLVLVLELERGIQVREEIGVVEDVRV